MTLTLEEEARRDLENAVRMGRVWDDIFASLFNFTDARPEHGTRGPDGAASASVTRVDGPSVTPPSTITIRTIEGGNGKRIAENIYGRYGVNHTNQWGWIVDCVKDYFGCDEDDVSCVQTDDGDLIAVCGKLQAFTEIE